MIENLQKMSEQVAKIENMHSESVPVLEGEYYTPPVSQTRTATPSKLGQLEGQPMNSWEFIGYGEEMGVILRHINEPGYASSFEGLHEVPIYEGGCRV